MKSKRIKVKIAAYVCLALLGLMTISQFGIKVKADNDTMSMFTGNEVYIYMNGDNAEISNINLENGMVTDSVSPEEVYSWGPVSALLVYTSVMQLSEQGKIDLDASIMEYMPEEFKSGVKFSSDFTVRQLMNHQAGFQNVYYYRYTSNPADLVSLDKLVIDCAPDQIFMPGTTVAYSEYGICLLAYMVQNVSDMNFDTYVKANILEPLGMTDTSVRANHEDNTYIGDLYRESKYYNYNGEYGLPYYSSMYPALSVVGTVQDMAIFAQGLVSGEVFEKESTKEEFFTPSVLYLDGETPRLASGMAVFKYGDNNEIYGTVGTGMISRAGMLLNVKDGSVLCMVSNQYAPNDYWNKYSQEKFGEMSGIAESFPEDISGRYTKSVMISSGKLSFLGILDTFQIDMAKGKPIAFLAGGDLINIDGIQGKLYKEGGSTQIQFAYYDILPYSSGMFILKTGLFILMALAYMYALISLPVGAFIFLKNRFANEKKTPVFRKYYYIQSAVIFFYFLFFLSMCMSAMSSGSPRFTMVVSFTYYIGIVMSFVYLVFLVRTGRKEECSVFEKGNYYINGYNALLVMVFTLIYKLLLF